MKLLRVFQLDPRISQGLRAQRKLLTLGLICVAAGALMTAATIPLTERAIRAINDASPQAVDLGRGQAYDQELAERLGLRVERVREAIARHPLPPSQVLPPAEILAEELGKSPAEVTAALEGLQTQTALAESPQARQDRALSQLLNICLLVVVIFAAKYWFTRGQSYFLSTAANRLAADLRIRLYDKLQRLPINYFSGKRVGSIQSVLTNDVNVYQNAVNIVRDSIDGPFKAVAAILTIFVIQWKLAVVALLFVPVLAWFVQRNGQKMKRDQAKVQDELATLQGVANEALSGVRVVKAFAAEDRMTQLFDGMVEESFKAQSRAARRFSQLRPMVELIGAVSLATILYICGHMARAGELQISQIVALTIALDVINQGSRALSGVNNTYNQVRAATDRIYGEILDRPDEAQGDAPGATLPNPVGEIEFRNVSFAYPDGTSALQNVSFTIRPGTSLALVGPSGAGKSTIADLLLRFYDPTEGQILFDGVDIRTLQLSWLRRQFGVVPQQTFLFAGTIQDNIRLGNEAATDAEVARAAELAHANGFIERSPARYDTVLGERGAKVSGGEGQRIAIARALVRDPRILLLDEATSNLDAESEKAVTEALTEVMQSRTTLFIAHRLTTAMRADQILVLRRGQIIEQGAPQSLLQADGVFAGMMRAFQSGMLDETLG